jgi:hypothetical protein
VCAVGKARDSFAQSLMLASRSCPHCRSRPPRDEAVGAATGLDFRLLGHLEGIIHLDAKVANGTLKFGVAEQ